MEKMLFLTAVRKFKSFNPLRLQKGKEAFFPPRAFRKELLLALPLGWVSETETNSDHKQ